MPHLLLNDLKDVSWRPEDHAFLVDGVWVPHKADKSDVSYPDQFRTRMADLEETSLWFRSRNLLIETILQTYTDTASLLEVGAGNGVVAAHLQKKGISVIAVEPGLAGAAACASRNLEVVFGGTLEEFCLPTESVHAVGLFDVIEHLDTPRELLMEAHRLLKGGGTCILTVPAYKFLWSQADVHAGHFQRYRRHSLNRLLDECGFERKFSSYCFLGAVVPLFALRTLPFLLGRRLDDTEFTISLERELAGQGRLTRQLGWLLARIEARWMKMATIPMGTSIVGVYQKRWSS